MSKLAYLKPYLKKHLTLLIIGFIALIFCDFSQLAIPRVLGKAIDVLAEDGASLNDLVKPVIYIIILAWAVALLRYVWRRTIVGFSRIMEKELRSSLYKRLVILTPRWHSHRSSGDLMALATNDIEAVRISISFGIIVLTDSLVMGVVVIIFMFQISPTLAIWALLPMPFITILARVFSRHIHKRMLKVQNSFGNLTEVVREQISGFKVIRAMGLSHLAVSESDKASSDYLKKNMEVVYLMGGFFPLLTFLINISVAIVIYFGGRETISGYISTGDFVAFMSYLALLSWPMMALGLVFSYVQQGLASLARLNTIFSASDYIENLEDDPNFKIEKPLKIEFENLNFAYKKNQKNVLKNINLTLNSKEITALVGPLGCGKSTLASLLPYIQQAPKKTFKINSVYVEDWPVNNLRQQFAYVPQEAFMFSGTVYENLIFGNEKATEDDVWKVVEQAGLINDVHSFKNGLQTMVGERGLNISGGQRQRLALARALISKAEYLIMDDTLSAVDAVIEDQILNNIFSLEQGALIITHRIVGLKNVDRILVMENGQITADGKFEDLIKEDGYFQKIYKLAVLADTLEREGPYETER